MWFKSTIMKREQKPRQRRLDLINSMPTGEQKRIARLLKCSNSHVSAVLNGRKQQDNDLSRNIIRLAEQSAANEAGKRFFKSGR
jgi:transcriptional regulator